MKVAVGSTNPVKVTAVRQTITRLWPEAEIVPVAVPSGVSEMPMTDEETRIGAHNRALAARDALDADFGVGLEGGVQPEPFGLTLHGWVVVVDRSGRTGIGGGGRLPLPAHIAQKVLAGTELVSMDFIKRWLNRGSVNEPADRLMETCRMLSSKSTLPPSQASVNAMARSSRADMRP